MSAFHVRLCGVSACAESIVEKCKSCVGLHGQKYYIRKTLHLYICHVSPRVVFSEMTGLFPLYKNYSNSEWATQNMVWMCVYVMPWNGLVSYLGCIGVCQFLIKNINRAKRIYFLNTTKFPSILYTGHWFCLKDHKGINPLILKTSDKHICLFERTVIHNLLIQHISGVSTCPASYIIISSCSMLVKIVLLYKDIELGGWMGTEAKRSWMVYLRPSAGEQFLVQAQGVFSNPAVMWKISGLFGICEPNIERAVMNGTFLCLLWL